MTPSCVIDFGGVVFVFFEPEKTMNVTEVSDGYMGITEVSDGHV
jgi:hypothetical protein